MSVIHCSPDFYVTLLEIFKTYDYELTLFDLYSRYLVTKSKTHQGITEAQQIPLIIITKMIIANSQNYNQRYPDSVDSSIANNKQALEYLRFGKVNHEYLKLIETKQELVVQAINYWLYQTGDDRNESQIDKLAKEAARNYAFYITTKKMPYVWGIPSVGDKIEVITRHI